MARSRKEDDDTIAEAGAMVDENTPLIAKDSAATGVSEEPTSFFGLERSLLWAIVPILLGYRYLLLNKRDIIADKGSTLADFGDGAIFRTVNVQIGFDLHNPYRIASLFIIYTIMMAVCQPYYSFAKDRVGWLKPLLFSYVVFSVGMVIGCASGRNFGWLFTARLVTAIGSAGMVFVPNLFLNDVVPRHLIPYWEAIQGAVVLLGQLIGSSLAGSVQHVESLDWVMIGRTKAILLTISRLFLIQVILPAFAFGFALWKTVSLGNSHYPASIAPPSARSQTISEDEKWSSIVSTTLLVLSVGTLCSGLSLLGHQLEFNIWLESSMLVLGALFALALAVHQKRLASQHSGAGLFPIDLDDHLRFDLSVVFVVMFLISGAISAFTFVLPWLARSAQSSSAWLLRPYWIGDFVGSIVVAEYTRRYNRVKQPMAIGVIACFVSSAIMFIWWEGMRSLTVCPVLIGIIGIGSGIVTDGLRPLFLSALRTKPEYKSRMYTLFHLAAILPDLIITAISNTLIQNTDSRSSPIHLVNEIVQAITFGKGPHGRHLERLLSTTSSVAEDVPMKSLSPVICMVMGFSLFAAVIILCFVEDTELEDRSERSGNANQAAMLVSEDQNQHDGTVG